jgi:dihydropteroate synthase
MKKTQLMGILNATLDSFYDGGEHFDLEKGLQHGFKLIEEGADLLDIGGESSRPGATPVSIEEEKRRVLPLIEALSPRIKISIDTSKPEVALAAIKKGAKFLNDITGFQNPHMRKIAADTDVEICVMHMQGTPQTMQNSPHYPGGILSEITLFFQKQIDLLLKDGVKPERIVLDPGIGFGKTVEDCLTLLRNLSHFQDLGFPLLLGISRKSFLSKIFKKPSEELLSTTLVMNTISLLEGVSIIRVHDVKEHRDAIDMVAIFKNMKES